MLHCDIFLIRIVCHVNCSYPVDCDIMSDLMYRCYCAMLLLMIVYVCVLMQTPVMIGVAMVGTDTEFNQSTDTR